MILKDSIRHNLTSFSRITENQSSLGSATVVIAIIEENTPYFLLTRRASKLRKHAGQYALPGGKVDEGESIEQAALRELEEELGIQVSEENILGKLDDYTTRSGFVITPLVVWVRENISLTPNSDEVAKVFRIPLSDLDRENLVNLDSGETESKPILSINLAFARIALYARQ